MDPTVPEWTRMAPPLKPKRALLVQAFHMLHAPPAESTQLMAWTSHSTYEFLLCCKDLPRSKRSKPDIATQLICRKLD